MSGQRGRLRTVIRHPLPFALLLLVVSIVLVNTVFPRSLPADPEARLEVLQAAEFPGEAKPVLEELLDADPLNVRWNYLYINNEYLLGLISDGGEGEATERYRALLEEPGGADVANYSLGLISGLVHDYEEALEYFGRVHDTRLAYLNNSIGYALREQGRGAGAEPYFRTEIELGGNVAGAVANLLLVYFAEGRLDEVRALADDATTGPYVTMGDLRALAFRCGDAASYLWLTFVAPFGRIAVLAALSALLICAMWFIYLWRIDIFEQEPLPLLVVTLLLGAFFALTSFVFSDLLSLVLPMSLAGDWLNDLVFSLLHIGLVEEIAKFLPVLLVIALSRQANEPIDYLIYGSLSALGFATLENSMYFTAYGLGIVYVRFLISTVLHIAMTGTVCYLWARARFMKPGNQVVAVITGLVIATVAHGLFDYFILGPVTDLLPLSIVILAVLAVAYGLMLRSSLRASPFFRAEQIGSRRLVNYELMVSTALVLLVIGYLFTNFQLSTELAGYQLLAMAWSSPVAVAAVFISLGEIGLKPAARGQAGEGKAYD
jgi:RsiW-degrading membrane proteinase PrsW (M82 family)